MAAHWLRSGAISAHLAAVRVGLCGKMGEAGRADRVLFLSGGAEGR